MDKLLRVKIKSAIACNSLTLRLLSIPEPNSFNFLLQVPLPAQQISTRVKITHNLRQKSIFMYYSRSILSQGNNRILKNQKNYPLYETGLKKPKNLVGPICHKLPDWVTRTPFISKIILAGSKFSIQSMR